MVDHPYNTAYLNGMKMVAQAYGVKLKTMVANYDINIQAQQVDQAINLHPDMVIINPVDAQACTPLVKRLYDAGIPVIASNLMASSERCGIVWRGPARMIGSVSQADSKIRGPYALRGAAMSLVQHRPGFAVLFLQNIFGHYRTQKNCSSDEAVSNADDGFEPEKRVCRLSQTGLRGSARNLRVLLVV